MRLKPPRQLFAEHYHPTIPPIEMLRKYAGSSIIAMRLERPDQFSIPFHYLSEKKVLPSKSSPPISITIDILVVSFIDHIGVLSHRILITQHQ